MEKKLSILVLLFVGLLTSCLGDIGPQGPPGFDGLNGLNGLDGADGLIGSIFEADITFTAENEYQALVDFPTSIIVLDTDIVIAYILTGEDNGSDIWEPLPQTLFFGSDILLYGYDYTFSNIRFFLDGTIDLASLEPLYTDNVIFRVAIIPADLATKINTSNINEVMGALQIENVKRIQ